MEKILAQKYATAFLNIFSQSLKISDIEQCQRTIEFLRTHTTFFILLQAPFISQKKRTETIKKLFEPYAHSTLFLKLIDLLCAKNRLFLLPDVLQALVNRYYYSNGYSHFVVSSSHEMTTHEQEFALEYLTKATGKKIMPTYTIDTQLIAGLRLQSSTLLWEYSIQKQLKAIERQFVRREPSNGY